MKTKLLSLSSILLIFSCALIPISLAEYQHTTISECSQPITTGWVRINVTFDCTFFGYQISITNFGDEPVEGNLTIRITTEAWIVLKG
ncbi:MAG: hypothetical protein KKC68_00415, partial [Candidatus Thermoplasmatota archaeon]|nr:hypothetical protein [Candidatus Thermoplasmatota archaeon]MBU1940215.1 hypothetical protein [Candidatus Thermoplasmatota archaeon]